MSNNFHNIKSKQYLLGKTTSKPFPGRELTLTLS